MKEEDHKKASAQVPREDAAMPALPRLADFPAVAEAVEEEEAPGLSGGGLAVGAPALASDAAAGAFASAAAYDACGIDPLAAAEAVGSRAETATPASKASGDFRGEETDSEENE